MGGVWRWDSGRELAGDGEIVLEAGGDGDNWLRELERFRNSEGEKRGVGHWKKVSERKREGEGRKERKGEKE